MRRTAHLLATLALLSGCRGDQVPTEAIVRVQPQAAASQSPVTATQNRQLAALRRATAPFQNFGTATAAGWSAQITPCMTSAAGGMGFHYGNTALFDATVRVEAPELLLYEPDQNGRLRLVAVEYIIPYTARSRSATPPVLFGLPFTRNDTFRLWGLHAWVWKENPNGIFADWNPRVTCAHTNNASSMAH